MIEIRLFVDNPTPAPGWIPSLKETPNYCCKTRLRVGGIHGEGDKQKVKMNILWYSFHGWPTCR
jgi:hypothetical protein